MQDPTAKAHGAAASLPTPSSLLLVQDVRHASLPQPHLPTDRVYAAQVPSVYAPQANSPYPQVLTHPHENLQTSEPKFQATTYMPTMVRDNTVSPTDWYASQATMFKSQNPPLLVPVPAISTSMPTYQNVPPLHFTP